MIDDGGTASRVERFLKARYKVVLSEGRVRGIQRVKIDPYPSGVLDERTILHLNEKSQAARGDFLVSNDGETWMVVESKQTGRAPYTPQQEIHYPRINKDGGRLYQYQEAWVGGVAVNKRYTPSGRNVQSTLTIYESDIIALENGLLDWDDFVKSREGLHAPGEDPDRMARLDAERARVGSRATVDPGTSNRLEAPDTSPARKQKVNKRLARSSPRVIVPKANILAKLARYILAPLGLVLVAVDVHKVIRLLLEGKVVEALDYSAMAIFFPVGIARGILEWRDAKAEDKAIRAALESDALAKVLQEMQGVLTKDPLSLSEVYIQLSSKKGDVSFSGNFGFVTLSVTLENAKGLGGLSGQGYRYEVLSTVTPSKILSVDPLRKGQKRDAVKISEPYLDPKGAFRRVDLTLHNTRPLFAPLDHIWVVVWQSTVLLTEGIAEFKLAELEKKEDLQRALAKFVMSCSNVVADLWNDHIYGWNESQQDFDNGDASEPRIQTIKRVEKSLEHIEREIKMFMRLVRDSTVVLNDSSVTEVDGDTEREIIQNGYTLARRMASGVRAFGTRYIRWNSVPPRNGIFYNQAFPNDIFEELTQSLRTLPAFRVTTFKAPAGNLTL